MKTNKVTKLGISLLSVAALGVVAPALTDNPVFGVAVVKAEEQQGQIKIRIRYLDEHSREIAPMYTGVLNPGESVNIYKDIEGHQVVSNFSWMPGYNLTYNIASTFFYGANDGYLEGYLRYKKLDADVKPSETPKPEVKPETKPSETPKPEVKPSEKPDAEAEEQQKKPLKYRVDYIGESGEKVAPSKFGVLNPGETVNIYKDIEGHEVVSRFEWLPGYNMDYDTLSTYSGFADGYNYMYLKYKKLNPAPTPTPEPEVKPEPKPSETPKPEVKPEPKPSDTSKPEVKPETKPSETPKPEVKPSEKPDAEAEEQKPIKYRISYYDRETGEEIAAEKTGVLNPGETVNIYKDIDGYEIVSKISWMPGYNTTYKIASVYFHGDPDGYHGMYLDYRKLNTDVKPSETSKPEVKPETKPSDTSKPEVKPETNPSETPKPEVTPETKPSETPKPEVKPETNPSETPKPEVKPETKPSDTPKPEVKPETKPSDTSKPEVKPETKPSDTPKPGVKPEAKPSETPKPEAKPETKPSDTPKPEVKPETKPSETPKPEVKPETKPSDTPKPEVKPETKPSETSKPEVKPETKPSDMPKPGVKPETKPQTNSNTAPQAPVKPVGQDSNTKADKPASKPETTALPNTGEQNSILGFAGFLLASLGLAGLTYKGRH